MIRFILLLGLSLWGQNVYAQTDSVQTDTLKFEYPELRKPTKAALLSAAIPGAGQIYNKKAWQFRVPLIYLGGTIIGYLIIDNHAEFKNYREAFIARNDGNPNNLEDPFYEQFSDQRLIQVRDNFRRDRDFYIIIGTFWYVLNIADAAVTAHLNEFSINDDLSLRVVPQREQIGLGGNQTLMGITLQIPVR